MPKPLTFEEVSARLIDPDFTLVDVLPRESYERAHLPGALHLPLDRLERDARGRVPDQDVDIGVYCAGPD